MSRRSETPARRSGSRSGRRVEPRVDAPGLEPTHLDVDRLLADRSIHIVVCCGAGGVGKTTTSAALALRAAEQGRRVCVLTIDPARRLAQSMGLDELDNVPRPVQGVDTSAGGSLDAMMLDMKRTFDEVVEAHASPDKAAQILKNPFYVALSSSFAGTQEYMAMEKLGQLRAQASAVAEGKATTSVDDGVKAWDLIVVDTPPSRSALDFLDAPERLSSLLDGKFIRVILAPAKGPARLLSVGMGLVTGAINKILGGQMLSDVQTFIAAFDTLFGGFRQRASATYALLQADETAFVVVAAPEPDAMREASYFVERLASEDMPLAGVVLNRTHGSSVTDVSAADAESAALRLRRDDGPATDLAADLLDVHADVQRIAARERRQRERFVQSHAAVPIVPVPALAGDVHDLEGLRTVGQSLAGPGHDPVNS